MGDVDDFAVIGGGIVGLALARRLALDGRHVTVLEKEDDVGRHQTGHNSGVVHAGLYYAPGSLKATLCRDGRVLMREFCTEKGIDYRALGKVVVAVDDTETAGLDAIFARAERNGVPGLRRLDAAGLAEIEPAVRGVAAVHSPQSAVTDFVAVARAMADDVRAAGGVVRVGAAVSGVRTVAGGVRVDGGDPVRGTYRRVVVCAGLGTDTIAPAADDGVRVVPFRGEYHRLTERLRSRVRGLVYPVPDPRYPFLGVHLTRHVDDEVLVGPSAVLATAPEGYRRRDVDARALRRLAGYPGLWRFARTHWRTGLREMAMSASLHAYARQARRYLPELTASDLEPYPAGVRAQALRRDGSLVDDFEIDHEDGVTVVRNAPSPAATSSLAIAAYLARELV
ncbi:L-2-hydroxyglutarate oxidase [Jatrophihabitans endophyticus]|uniref:L-2-hydroxyglutarate oxidase n=1 Tax=Jatrophihabitans endophyticus TaxID=1206085 RepID=UPI0019E2B816|nr:L-2-hydroxyglutarate oxidase [Jatrophihabitans endophyticus]MBE7187638.1 L-2-hydroxyglutarate oxidase [Jatrophihabitans endophyticus]